ncbi:MAG: ABC transporter permease subunit [Pedosphaera sp.]|nr:ABC transporter permease subunit [Pedosphaera sp.]
MNWSLLQNSFLVSSAATLLAVAFGFAGAVAVCCLPPGIQRVAIGGSITALAMPPFLVTNCWLSLLGDGGAWRAWVPFNIFTPSGTVWILALLTWPITLLLVRGAWASLDAAHLETDPALHGWTVLRWVLWPMARPVMGLASLLIFVLTFNNFAVPAILQTKVFPAALWVSFNTTFNYAEALKLALPQIIVPTLILGWLFRRGVAWPELRGSPGTAVFRKRLGRLWVGGAHVIACLLLIFSVVLPAVELGTSARTWIELPGALAAGTGAIWNSVLGAGVAASTCGAIGWFGVRQRWLGLTWVLFFAPGVTLGIALIYILNRPWTSALYQSVGVVLIGFALRYVALGWSAARRAFESCDPDVDAASRLDGANNRQRLRHVQWPQVAPALGAAWYVVYLLCLWDVETLLLIIPPGGETLSLRIFNLLHYGHSTQVNALCLALLGVALAPLAIWHLWGVIQKRDILRSILPKPIAIGLGLIGVLFSTGCQQEGADKAPLKSAFFESVQIIGNAGTALGQFNKPRSIAVDRQDNIYVADMTGRIQKFSPDGKFLAHWQMPETDLGKPKGMCRDTDGNIVVIEPHYQRVNHFSTDGKLVRQWGQHGTNQGQLVLPRAIAISPKGNTYVSEYTTVDRVQRFSKNGEQWISTFGVTGTHPGEFNRAEGLGLDLAGQIYVADSCNHRIQVFSEDGKFLRAYGRAGSRQGELSYPYDVQVDTNGNQFVCEFGNSRLQVFDPSGNSVEIIGRAGGAPGEFNNPWSIALDSKGNLYVADSKNHRVQKLIRKPTFGRSGA